MQDRHAFIERLLEWAKLLGLEGWHWDFRTANIKESALTLADPTYLSVTLTLNPELLLHKKEWDEVIVHELVHVQMSIYDYFVDNSTKKGWQDLVRFSRENSTTQIARSIIKLANTDMHYVAKEGE